jgi:ubiquinone/menaquinone biosynthesis C-methylase UbiE
MRNRLKTLWSLTRVLGLRNVRRLSAIRGRVWGDVISRQFTTRSIQTMLHVGLLDAMQREGAVDVAAFADKEGLDRRLVVGICEALFARRVLQKDGATRFRLDDLGRLIMEEQLARGWFDLAYGYEPVLHRMEDLVRKKAVYGRDVVRDGLHVAVGSGLASVAFFFPMVAEGIARAGYRKVLDLGCGDGTFLRLLAGRIPSLRGTGIDLSPEAVGNGNAVMAAQGLADRFRLYVGDVTELDRIAEATDGVDAVTTSFVLHEISKSPDQRETVDFLKMFRRALPGVPFVIVETDRPTPEEMRAEPGFAIEYFLFHDLSGQQALSRATWIDLFQRAGFTSIAEEYIRFARTCIFTVK